MKQAMKVMIVIALLAGVLCGCSMHTISELYCLPMRSEEYTGLRSAIDQIMNGREYSAPISGENRQTVQSTDLDGDGIVEYILFSKSLDEKPLQIFIFSLDGEDYVLLDRIDCNGSAFEQVEYVQMNDRPGMEIVVGRQVSDQVLRTVSVYTLVNGQMEQVLSSGYTKFLCSDLDKDNLSELLILRPSSANPNNGIAEMFGFEGSTMERSPEINMSGSAESIKRIMLGTLNDGVHAMYVASSVDNSTLITDIYAVVDGIFTNVSFSNESGTSVQTLRNYYVYADDIDSDGVLELPSLITMKTTETNETEQQYLIRWFAMTSLGQEVDKQYTYHNFVGGWYLQLDKTLAPRITVSPKGNSYEFSLWDESLSQTEKLLTIYVLTGQKREEQAVEDNRFVIYKTDTTIYAGNLEVASAAYGISRESLIQSFRLILQDWKTGEI
ncbi:MAG: hypothetical protein IJA45_01650 [Oscillospiraceae bacterium]|nr:hypothetical protein [Oscillospiraceae bacterium]